MRKVLIATIVAMVLFAVGAFAAQIADIGDTNLASGEGAIVACDTAPVVEFQVGAHNGTDWPITGAVVNTTCPEGTEVEIVIAQGGTGSGELDANGDATFPIANGSAAEPAVAYDLRLGGILV